jgi:predicted dehydrogenase
MTRPRLGFLGVGWIGRARMAALQASGVAEIAVIVDPSRENASEATRIAPHATLLDSFERLLEEPLDGLVIATPSALHVDQAIAALDRGLAVFCQKPLALNARQAGAVVQAARRADRLLDVDFCYRWTRAAQAIQALVRSGELGPVHSVDLTFHNSYGPDKDWFYNPALSGGGCVIDLGVHLVDLALWMLDWPEVESVNSDLFAKGAPLVDRLSQVEDHAIATIRLRTGAVLRLACSWRLHAGRDAVIEASFYGPSGGAAFRNVDGSFYDFLAEHYRGTCCETLAAPPDDWGGRAAIEWISRLAIDPGFDPAAERYVEVTRLLDAIYA